MESEICLDSGSRAEGGGRTARPWRFKKIHYSYKEGFDRGEGSTTIEKLSIGRVNDAVLIANTNYKKLQPRDDSHV